MNRRRFNWASLSLLAVLTACGGDDSDDGSTTRELATVSTLAYVVTECRSEAQALTIRQSLQIRQGEQAPITVVEHAALAPGVGVFCDAVGRRRQSPWFADLGVFRRLGVSPDGSQVVFEVTDEIGGLVLPLVFPYGRIPAEQKGIFAVGADGSGVRRLGPASRVASNYLSLFVFSPSGRTIAYTDYGPDPTGANAVQIFTLDVLTGERRQVTQLPPTTGNFGGVYEPFFNDEHTITFYTWSNADGNHPDASENLVVTVSTDGTGFTVAPPVMALPGAEVLTRFRITGSELDAAVLTVGGMAKNPGPERGGFLIQEVFDIDRDNNILQLTNFGRVDTFTPTVSADGERVLFSASADPLGTNPTENCQIFSIDRTGGDLRQLTDFREVGDGELSIGCAFSQRPLGCGVYEVSRDARTGAMLFYSTCDPLGTNPYGSQVFAMHADGAGRRQLTTTRGYTRDASGAVTAELPFPFAWPGLQFRSQVNPPNSQPGLQVRNQLTPPND